MAMFEKKIKCPNCGEESPISARFCYSCGSVLEQESSEEVVDKEDKGKKKVVFPDYLHPSDAIALKALKAIPGFGPLMKAFMSTFSERAFNITNRANYLKLSEEQMPKYYNMLPPICEKLGIEIPDLYVKLDVEPNAYTVGDTKPAIVIHSGLFETLPDELIPTVLAHECGHIACHHCLYTTMGRMIFNEAAVLASKTIFGGLITFPLAVAYFNWRRAAELSADRAAAIYDGTTEKVVEMCMYFAGYDKDIHDSVSKELFMKQADDYREMVSNSKWDKTLEFLVSFDLDHPMNAVRAAECYDWGKTEDFASYIK